MISVSRNGLAASAIAMIALAAVPTAHAQTMSVVERPDGTRVETSIISPTHIRVTLSGGPSYASPLTVDYTDIAYGATEIVYTGTLTHNGVTEALSCRVNNATGAVTGTGACEQALGSGTSTTETPTTPDSTTTTTPTTNPDGTTTIGGTITDTSGTTTVVVTQPSNPADQGRAWVRSGALAALAPDLPVARVIESLAATTDAALDPVYQALQALPSDTDRAAAVSQLEPVAPAAPLTSTITVSRTVTGTVVARTTAVRGGTGVSTGDLARGLDVWIQPFGHHAEQGMRNGQDGFDSTTIGLSVGADTALSETVRAGVALSYSGSSADGRDGATGNDVDMRGGHLALYAQYENPVFYLTGQASGGITNYDSQRTITLTNQLASADYDGWHAGARVDAGMPLAAGNGWQVTPMAGLSYLHSHMDGYTETGAGALNLAVGSQGNDSLMASLGGRVSTDVMANGVTWTPYLQALANYELLDERPEVTARFTGGGSSFTTQGAEPARLGGDLTVGLELLTSSNLSLDAAYTFGVREDYQAHAGSLLARLKF